MNVKDIHYFYTKKIAKIQMKKKTQRKFERNKEH